MQCKCAQCYGLREYLIDHGLDPRGLPAARGHQSVKVIEPCDKTYVCTCRSCKESRKRLEAHRAWKNDGT